MHEIHAPPLERPTGYRGGSPMQRHMLTPPDPHPHLQPVEPVEPAHPLAIHWPPLTAQQHPDAQVAKARPRLRELANPGSQGRLIPRPASAIPRRPTELRQPTGPRTTDLGTSPETIRGAPDGARASGGFSQRLRQHVFVERELGDEPFEPMAILLELPESSQLAHPQAGILLLPRIERHLAHAQLPADIPDRGAALDLAQGVGHLLLRGFRALHRSPRYAVDRRSGNSTLVLTRRRSRGRRQWRARTVRKAWRKRSIRFVSRLDHRSRRLTVKKKLPPGMKLGRYAVTAAP